MHGGSSVPVSVLAASEQITYATQETNDEAIETSTEKTSTNHEKGMMRRMKDIRNHHRWEADAAERSKFDQVLLRSQMVPPRAST